MVFFLYGADPPVDGARGALPLVMMITEWGIFAGSRRRTQVDLINTTMESRQLFIASPPPRNYIQGQASEATGEGRPDCQERGGACEQDAQDITQEEEQEEDSQAVPVHTVTLPLRQVSTVCFTAWM